MNRIKISHTYFPNGHLCKYDLVKDRMDSLWYRNIFGDFIFGWYKIGRERKNL